MSGVVEGWQALQAQNKAMVTFSIEIPAAGWTLYRAGAPMALVTDMCPIPQENIWLFKVPALVLRDILTASGWGLTRLAAAVTAAVGSQSPAQQQVFYGWNRGDFSYIARAFDADEADPRVLMLGLFIETMTKLTVYWDDDRTGLLTGLLPYWFEMCDAAHGLPTARLVTA